MPANMKQIRREIPKRIVRIRSRPLPERGEEEGETEPEGMGGGVEGFLRLYEFMSNRIIDYKNQYKDTQIYK